MCFDGRFITRVQKVKDIHLEQGIIHLQYIHRDLMKSEILYNCECSLIYTEDLLSLYIAQLNFDNK